MMHNPLQYTAKKTQKAEDDKKPQTTRIEQFNMILYYDTESYNIEEVLNRVTTDSHIASYAYITHNNDFFTEETFDKHGNLLGHMGERKKDHVHVTCSLRSKSAITNVALWLGVPQNFIEKCKSFEKSLLYLTHRNAEDKKPYKLEEVTTNIKDYIEYLYNSYEPKQTPIESLYRYFDSSPYPTCGGFLEFYGIENACDLIKYWRIIEKLIDEKRSRLDKMEENAVIEQLNQRKQEETIKKLCENFPKVEVTETGNAYTQYTLSEDGKLDVLGFRVGEDE